MPTVSVSPAVQFYETDLTAVVPAVATSIGAFAGDFNWGPVLDPTTVSNESVLASVFGKPTNSNYVSFFSAKNFLDYSSNLLLVRASATAMKNASAISTTPLAINNYNDYEIGDGLNTYSGLGMYAAKYPGTKGNSLKVSICDAATYSRTLAGTVAVALNGNTLTGTGTAFDTALTVGDWVFVTLTVASTPTTVAAKVTAVGSATSATVSVQGYANGFPAVGTALTATAKWEYYNEFDGAPLSSDEMNQMNSNLSTPMYDGLHIVVADEKGFFTGNIGQILEKFSNVYKSSNAKRFDGTSGYYKNVLKNSAYVWWCNHPIVAQVTATGTDFGGAIVANTAYKQLKTPYTIQLSGGADGTPTEGEIQTAYNLLANPEKYDISLLISGQPSVATAKVIMSIAETRMDCVAFLSAFDPSNNGFIIGDTTTNLSKMITYRNTTLGGSSSYSFMDSGVKYQYDKYNDVYRWVPLNADMAGLCARTDYIAETWFAPAGLNRGGVKNAIKLGFNPDKTSRDELFKNGINPVVSFPGEGIVLFGDKTMQTRPSAFDAINVRRLFIVLEKSIATAAKYFLFEQNDPITRQIFVNMVTPFLRGVKGRRGIDDFLVDVGPTVNTAEVVNLRQFKGNIYVRPVGAIRNIVLNFIATPYGVSFSEYALA